MIESGALVYERSAAGDTPLHLFCEYTQNADDVLKICSLLLEKGARVDARNLAGETPLHKLSLNKCDANVRRALLKMLLAGHADPTLTTHKQLETPLHYAARVDDADFVAQLLQAGADIDAKTASGLTALDVADQAKHVAVVDVLHRSSALGELKRTLAKKGVLVRECR